MPSTISTALSFRHLSFTQRHPLDLFAQRSPVFSLEFGIFHPLLAPVLVESTDMVLALLEVEKLVTNALLDENSSCVLLNNAFFVLCTC